MAASLGLEAKPWPAREGPAETPDRGKPSGRGKTSGRVKSPSRKAPGRAKAPAAPAQPAPRPEQVRPQAAPARPQQAPARPQEAPARPKAAPGRSGRAAKRSKKLRRSLVIGGVGVVAAAVAVVALMPGSGSGPAHVLVVPAKIGAYVKEPHLAKVMDAAALQQQVITKSNGEAKNVVYAVYQDSAGAAAKGGPQIILFIGGNLSGTSASGFISSFTGQSKGAEKIDPGPLGGAAACLPLVQGGVAECAWADNDTFGVVASPTMSGAALAAELRVARPQVEHLAK